MCMHQGEIYNVLYTYESGYCEIKEAKEKIHYTVLLVHSSEIEVIRGAE